MRYLDLTLAQMYDWCESHLDHKGCKGCELSIRYPANAFWPARTVCVFRRCDATEWTEEPYLLRDCTWLGLELKRAGRRRLDLSLDLYAQASRLGCAPTFPGEPWQWKLWKMERVPGSYRRRAVPDPDDPLLREPGPDFQSLHPEIYGTGT